MRLDTDLAMYAYVGGEAKNEPPIFLPNIINYYKIVRASPRIPKIVSQSKNFGKIEKNSSPTTPKPTFQSFGTWKKPPPHA